MTHDAPRPRGIPRRAVLGGMAAGAALAVADPFARMARALEPAVPGSDLFLVRDIPRDPFVAGGNRHRGVDGLLELMGSQGLKFYRLAEETPTGGASGMIATDDVVLVKVNAQWKYRGCTNSDLVRGIVQAVLDHPAGFTGEVVIVENGQGRGSLACATSRAYDGDTSVQANARNRLHSFTWLVRRLFDDPRVSLRQLDGMRERFIAADDHLTNGYRRLGIVSYPCFTTRGGRRVELREGIWTGNGYSPNLKLINVPVLKHHDEGGSEITGALKHVYGLLSMADGQGTGRHYERLGETCGRMMAEVRTPVLNILDAIWVSHRSLRGYPASATSRRDRILASQDPVALDAWGASHILYPIDRNPRHHPSHAGIRRWLVEARDTINGLGGLADSEAGIVAAEVTLDEAAMRVHRLSLAAPP